MATVHVFLALVMLTGQPYGIWRSNEGYQNKGACEVVKDKRAAEAEAYLMNTTGGAVHVASAACWTDKKAKELFGDKITLPSERGKQGT